MMSKYALISDQDIISDSNNEMELLQHLKKTLIQMNTKTFSRVVEQY